VRMAARTEFIYLDSELVTYRMHDTNMSRNARLLERDSLRVLEKGFDMPGLDGMDFEGDDGHGPGGGMGSPEMQKKLNLTDDQRTRLADIRDRQARAAIPIRSDLEIAGLDMRKLMRADKPDSKAIDAQIDKMAGLRARLQKSRVASMLEARAVLTPAQQKILRESRGGMGRGMRRGHGMHGMGRGGPGGPGGPGEGT